MSFHTVILAGSLGRDPELRYTPQGTAVANFSVAVDDSYTDASGERIKRTIWVRVSAWGKLGEVSNQYLSKGRKVLVEGKLVHDENGNPHTFTRNDGTPGAAFELRANAVRFLSAAPSGGAGDGAGSEEGSAPAGVEADDTIPF